jgi:hypothetical protein
MTIHLTQPTVTGAPYRTYVVGREAMLFEIPDIQMGHIYRSNWRVLHIDGFEPMLIQHVPVRYIYIDASVLRSDL